MGVRIIEQRTRALITDSWGAWSNLPVDSVTDGTFTDTDLIQYRFNTEITISDVTDNVSEVDSAIVGTGVFDDMMETVTKHLEYQFTQGRIIGSEYATVYLGAIQTTMTEAVRFVLQKDIAAKQGLTEDAKIALIQRQTKGFDDDAKQKLLKQALDSWSVAYSVAQDANSVPDSIKVNPIDSIMKNAMDNLGIVKSNDPLGEI